MEKVVNEVLFETRSHASRPYTSKYPPQQQLKSGGSQSLLSYLPFRGITQLKEKWSEYRQPKRLRRLATLFVSARGDYVAIASGNQVTILQKDDDYQEPVGTFKSGGNDVTFTCGTWSESHGLLIVADATDTIYIVRANGEEMTRIMKKHLKVSSPIVGLVVQDDTSRKKSYLCTFTVFVSDGLFHDIEISKDPSASIFSTQALNNAAMQSQSSLEICCWDYHPKLSLFAMVNNAHDIKSSFNGTLGSCNLSVWQRKQNLQMEPIVFAKSEGLYSITKGDQSQVTSPKLQFSPNGKFLASLDMEGCLFIFQFDEQNCSLIELSSGKGCSSKETVDSSGNEIELHDIVDFTWWSDDVVVIVKRNGTITMVDILSHVNVLNSKLEYSLPLLERTQEAPGLVFVLENTLDEDNNGSEQKGLIGYLMTEKPVQFEFSKLKWSLMSLVKRSALEIYENLIANQRYQAALDFSDRHGFDKDEVLKSQWLSSAHGVNEISVILPNIKDQGFVLSECVDRIGSTEDAMRTLLCLGLRLTESYRFAESEDVEDDQIWNVRMIRLKLLQYSDRLETFIGINMGRFSVQEYNRFRDMPLNKTALVLAETGKIGALNLLFKRHLYSLVPSMLEVLAAIPETVPVKSYGQLLPAGSAPSNVVLRDDDWVECEKMVSFINQSCANHESMIQYMTEPIVMKYMAFNWPSVSDLSSWYKKRARDIDTLSGQLDNCRYLIDLAISKGISELQHFAEDIFYLHQLIYSDENEDETSFSLSLTAWEQLPDYEKFKFIMMHSEEENIIPRLYEMAVPFMQSRFHALKGVDAIVDTQDKAVDSYLVRWLKEVAAQNNLELCLRVIEEGCRDLVNHQIFKDEAELIDCALQCIYLCPETDRWSTMSAILSKFPHMRDVDSGDVKHRLKLAEGHVEAGRLLTYYQVPKHMSFLLEAHMDEKAVKQILRLLLSKFIRWQPSRTDHDWVNMWHDLLALQEKAFPFLDLEYLLTEYCRGLLKAGKFSLAKNYLKGTSSVSLATDKAENLVIQAAREYFFSAPTLTCSEVWKARECLSILPSNRNVRAEADIIDAVTIRLPNLGVNLLPMAFKQIKDPMEIMKLAITSRSGAYQNLDELIEIAKLLGLRSEGDMSTVQEAIAREAAFAGDVQLAFDLCLVLAKKGHGSIWDLCAALARSQALESIDSKSQKLLLGFALSHCDEESIGELLHEWKDVDWLDQCETLIMSSGREPCEFQEKTSLSPGEFSGTPDVSFKLEEPQLTKVKSLLSLVAQDLSAENGYDWESVLQENRKVASLAASHLPWLLKLSENEFGKRFASGSVSTIQHFSVRTRAVMTTLSWLTKNGFVPRDDLVASLAKSIMEPPVSDGEDILGCSVLLNLMDAFHGAEIIEEQLKIRESYREFSSLMNAGMIYSMLHSSGIVCENPSQRRELLVDKFQEKYECTNVDEAQSTFWNGWKVKLEQQKKVADKSRVLEKLIPGVETSRFLSGDMEYIQNVVFSLIDSVRTEKKQVLEDALSLAQSYGLDRKKVILHYLSALLVSDVWSINDIMGEISDFKEEILSFAGEVVKSISSTVYPTIDGCDKKRLAYIYDLLSDCYMQLEQSQNSRFCKIVAVECRRVSSIKGLNFKNIAGLQGLNLDCFKDGVFAQLDENNVEILAKMVENLVPMDGDTVPTGLPSWKHVYTHYVFSCLATLEGKTIRETHFQNSGEINSLVRDIELTYDVCKRHVRFMEYQGVADMVLRFFTLVLLINKHIQHFPCDTAGKDSLLKIINFWIRLMKDMEQVLLNEMGERFFSECSVTCLKVLSELLVEEIVLPSQGWLTVVNYVVYGFNCNVANDTFNFIQAMIFGGCGFEAVARLFSEVVSQFPSESFFISTSEDSSVNIKDLPHLYLSILEPILHGIDQGIVERRNLHYLLSSLSKFEGDLEDLNKVRFAVWERISAFSDNLQLASHLRVYALELLQFISGRKRNIDVFTSDGPALLEPWEGWDDLQDKTANQACSSDDPTTKDTSNRFTSTLVALKSSQLISSISPGLEITPEDILSVDSAVSCFLKLSELITSRSHVDTLMAVLVEWEGLFMPRMDNSNSTLEESDTVNNWNNDDWDEGWESFPDEPVGKEMKESSGKTHSIHPLHTCWMIVVKKLIALSSHEDVMKLLDRNNGENHAKLLSEDDANSLTGNMLELDCFLALKIALLMPYEPVQLLCLDAVENKLKEGGVPDNTTQDHFFIVLILASGILSQVMTKASYGATFSYICFIVGNLCRQFQEAQASKRVDPIDGGKDSENQNFLFVRLVFPSFVAELVKANQHILAGFLVTKFVHMNVPLGLINVAEATLRTYLEKQLQEVGDKDKVLENRSFCEALSNTVLNLRRELGNLVQSAIALLLPNEVR